MKTQIKFKNNSIRKLLTVLKPAARRRVLTKWAHKAATYVAEHKLTGQVLNTRSGNLRRSLLSVSKGVVTRSGSVLIGTPLVYGHIHEYGGVIKPKNGKYLRFKGDQGWATVKRVKMPKRPWLRPDLKEFKKSKRGKELFFRYLLTEIRRASA